MKWPDLQNEFSQSLRDPEIEPGATIKPLAGGVLPIKRLNVYRNNVALSIINVLKDSYPTVAELVGDEFFNGMAKSFISEHLPSSPVMLEYGAEFDDFIKTYQPAEHLEYLGDIAALEWAMNIANHAGDAQSITIESLQEFAENELEDLKLGLHPSLRLVASDWPIVSIWYAHQQANPEEQLRNLPSGGEYALIIRPELSTETRAIAASTFTFIQSLQAGSPLGAAVATALERDENFNIAENLSGLFGAGAVIAIRPNKKT